MVDEADVVNEEVAGVPSRKRRDSRSPSPSPSPRDKRRKGELSPNPWKRISPASPSLSPQENMNQPSPPVSQPNTHIQQPPVITGDKPSINNGQINHNAKLTNHVSTKKRKLPEPESWNEQRKLARQSVNPQLRKLQQLHHNKIHGHGSSAFTTPLSVGKVKVESSKEISSILRNACMVPNSSSTKVTKGSIKNERTMSSNGINNDDTSNKSNKFGSLRKAMMKNKALQRVYELNAKLRQLISNEIRKPSQGTPDIGIFYVQYLSKPRPLVTIRFGRFCTSLVFNK